MQTCDTVEYKLYCGNSIEMLKQIPDKSVNCCITSPPYYGLRDYGTGKWVGGDENCPHRRLSKWSDKTITGHAQEELRGNVGDAIYKTVCPLCGAVRVDKQIGLEETPEQYIERLVDVFREVKRVLRDDGVLWVNIGDTYNASSYRKDEKSSGHGKQGTNKGSYENVVERPTAKNCKPKDLIGIPWMLAFALRNDGWYLRQDIIWEKVNSMPEPVKDRCTKSHEYIFMLTKKPHYWFDYKAIQEDAVSDSNKRKNKQNNTKSFDTLFSFDEAYDDSYYEDVESDCANTTTTTEQEKESNSNKRNKRDVWTTSVGSQVKESHFATYPKELITTPVLASCPEGGTVLDPFNGSGTTGVVALNLCRNYIGIDLKKDYLDITKKRIVTECTNMLVKEECTQVQDADVDKQVGKLSVDVHSRGLWSLLE